MVAIGQKAQIEPLAANLRVGLFGGSFNPAHAGHVHVGETARKRLGLDLVLWLVSPGNPLKHPDMWTKYATRVDSAQQITKRRPKQYVCESEMAFGTRYTLDTVRGFQARWPNTRFVWIIGSDNLANFHLWRDWQSIAREIPIAVIARPGDPARACLSPFARQFCRARLPALAAPILPAQNGPAWVYLSAPYCGLSSSALRDNSAIAPGSKL